MAEESSRIRVQIDFSPGAFAELVRLQELTEAPNRGETVRYALRALQWLAAEADPDGTLTIVKNGQKKQIVFPFLQPTSVPAPAVNG